MTWLGGIGISEVGLICWQFVKKVFCDVTSNFPYSHR